MGRRSPNVPASNRECGDLRDPFLVVGLPFCWAYRGAGDSRSDEEILLADTQSSECVGQCVGVLESHGGALSARWRKGVRSVTNEDDAAGRRAV
jgi:hypothetical protein